MWQIVSCLRCLLTANEDSLSVPIYIFESHFRTTMKSPLVNILNWHYSFLQLSSSACSTRGKRSSASFAITCGCTWGRSSGTTTKAQPSTSTTLTASPCTWRPGWCSWTVLSAWSCGRYAVGLPSTLPLQPFQNLLHAVHVSCYMQQGEKRIRAKVLISRILNT